MKLKEKQGEAGAQGEPCGEEKGLSAETEGEVDETFEGEMDNFQTPLVGRCPSAPVLFYVTDCPP